MDLKAAIEIVFPMSFGALCSQRTPAEAILYHFNRAGEFTGQIQEPESEFNRSRKANLIPTIEIHRS